MSYTNHAHSTPTHTSINAHESHNLKCIHWHSNTKAHDLYFEITWDARTFECTFSNKMCRYRGCKSYFELNRFEEVTIVPHLVKWKTSSITTVHSVRTVRVDECEPVASKVYILLIDGKPCAHSCIKMKLQNKFHLWHTRQSNANAFMHAYIIRIHLLFVQSYIPPFAYTCVYDNAQRWLCDDTLSWIA